MTIHYLNTKPALANGIAFAIATVCSYIANTLWSFTNSLQVRNLYRFFAVSVIGILLAMLVSGLIDSRGFHYGIGILAVAISVPTTTFLLHIFWTYR